ncbi:unnamed protein product [Angiostrongylus costaricensis]|uniref:SSD domain-containing protein n=1 Tax=Angiostrongylus costaricensis TaxID=334426 RepID=A0A0R3P9Y6_ANGCS|nr:unnamed protein product [Angiostrongylus costaricensis]
MRADVAERLLARAFGYYSGVVIACPLPFIITPVLVTIGLSTGLQWYTQALVKDEIDLYTPTNARVRAEIKQLDALFHINDTDPFYATRRYDVRRTGYIIITHRDEDQGIMNPLVMQSAMQLWSIVQSLTVEDQDRRINYPGICVKFPIPEELSGALHMFFGPNVTTPERICLSNPLVEIVKLMLLSDFSFLNQTRSELILEEVFNAILPDADRATHFFGGVTIDDEKRVVGAKAMKLPYALRHFSQDDEWLARQWELRLSDFLLHYYSPVIRVNWWTYETISAETSKDLNKLISMIGPCFAVVTVFTIATCCVWSWRRSRPWLALAGVFSAALAIMSGIGLLLLVGFGMTSVAYSVPFIILSVGVDNVFILLSAWRSTPSQASLEQRMKKTFADAGVSITVTSLTDIISFGVGCTTPFPSVQMFCTYALTAMVFTYVYQLTFLAGIMVYTNRREMDGRHCLTFRKIKNKANQPKEANKDRSFEKNHALSQFFRSTYADCLVNPFVRVLVIVAFLSYLVIAIWGCTKVKLGLEFDELLPEHSYGKETLRLTEKYFPDHGSSMHVWMYNLSKIDVSPERLWVLLSKEIELYEHTEFTGGADSWQSGLLITEENFVHLIKNAFLVRPQFERYRRDVVFDASGSMLDASRVTIQLREIGCGNRSRAMQFFRKLADISEFPTGVYSDFFQIAEQSNAILPGTLSSIAYASTAVIVVSLLLIPEPVISLWVSFSILSINIGILGFMTLWNVRLDFVSMVTIIMSIGFCVDFAGHLAYSFAKGRSHSVSERMRNALYTVGAPILQSATSTLLGVIFLASAESYMFKSFLKTISLVILLGEQEGYRTTSSHSPKRDDATHSSPYMTPEKSCCSEHATVEESAASAFASTRVSP